MGNIMNGSDTCAFKITFVTKVGLTDCRKCYNPVGSNPGLPIRRPAHLNKRPLHASLAIKHSKNVSSSPS